ncbi:YeeE/YedE thiosulfate transporter family protein [Pelotomaculum propionicicum]|uniref:YeeE/YedE thiosulfate transporter family protein n=1 Tax=Pelotomaculum propionicicum TaxID=258475 RepID=UPI003B7A931A
MMKTLHAKKGVQLIIGLIFGIIFGFLLQKGGVTRYDVIIGQLLLTDFTVLKVMLSAVVTGMAGVYALKGLGLAQLHPKPGSFGSSVVGGLIFGLGFGILGYCPGTVVGAVGQGSLDALFGGVVGVITGAGLFAAVYPKLEKGILKKGDFGAITVPQLLHVNPWLVIVPLCAVIIGLLAWLESAGL